jgi:hypothetical protein
MFDDDIKMIVNIIGGVTKQYRLLLQVIGWTSEEWKQFQQSTAPPAMKDMDVKAYRKLWIEKQCDGIVKNMLSLPFE